MTRFDVLTVAVRIFALLVLFQVMNEFPHVVAMQSQTDATGFGFIIATTVTQAIAAVVALLIAPGIATLLLPKKRVETPIAPWPKEDVLLVAIVILGLHFLVDASGSAAYWIMLLVRRAHDVRMPEPLTPERIAQMANVSFRLLVASILVVRPSSALRFLNRVQRRLGVAHAGH